MTYHDEIEKVISFICIKLFLIFFRVAHSPISSGLPRGSDISMNIFTSKSIPQNLATSIAGYPLGDNMKVPDHLEIKPTTNKCAVGQKGTEKAPSLS